MGYRDNFLRNEHLLTAGLLKKGNLTQSYPRYSQRSFITLFSSQHHFYPTVLLHQCIRARVEEEDKSTSPSPYPHCPTWITVRFSSKPTALANSELASRVPMWKPRQVTNITEINLEAKFLHNSCHKEWMKHVSIRGGNLRASSRNPDNEVSALRTSITTSG